MRGLLGKLGFRWLFFFTLPLPYHPAIMGLALLAPPLWIAWLGWSAFVDGGAEPRWYQPFMIALLLGIPLSIPFVAWALMMFRAHLAQAVLIAGSMLLLALDVVTGRVHPLWGALPGAFTLLYLVQAVGGRMWLAKAKRASLDWQPIDPGEMTVSVDDTKLDLARAHALIARCNIARVLSIPAATEENPNAPPMVMMHRFAEPAVEAVRAISGPTSRAGRVQERDGLAVVIRPVAQPPAECIAVTVTRPGLPSWIVWGDAARYRVVGPNVNRDVAWGNVAVIGWLPIFCFFHWTAILGGKSEWVVGFVRDRPVSLGPVDHGKAGLAELFMPRPGDGGRIDDPDCAAALTGGPSLQTLVEEHTEAQAGRIALFWDVIARKPASPDHHATIAELTKQPELFVEGDGARLCEWLAAAREARCVWAVRSAARLIARLPDPEFMAIRATVHVALKSRILGGEWRVSKDMDLSDVPKNCPRFGKVGGFGLLHAVPQIYERLAASGPEGADLVARLRASLPQMAKK